MENDIPHKKQRIIRVISTFKDKSFTCGTGFFVTANGKLLTCAHVVLGSDLTKIRQNAEFDQMKGESEHLRLEYFYKSRTATLQVQTEDGQFLNATLRYFDERRDIALLKVDANRAFAFFETDTVNDLELDNDLFFCGYQFAVDYETKSFPFTVNRGWCLHSLTRLLLVKSAGMFRSIA